MIPIALKKEEFRFIKIKKKLKIPLEKEWQTKNNYQYNDENLLNWIKKGGNYGIIGGYGELIGIDCDDKVAEQLVEENLPETFTVLTGTGKKHFYYFCKDGRSLKVFKDKTKSGLADIQFRGKQLMCVGSTHPNGNKYTLYKDTQIKEISMDRIIYCFRDYLIYSHIEKKRMKQTGTETDELCRQIKEKITMKELLDEQGIDTTKNPTECLWHSSKGGKCFSFDVHMFFCFHCEESGSIFDFYMKLKNVDFNTAKKELAKRCNIPLKSNKIIIQQTFSPKLFADQIFENDKFLFDKFKRFWRYDKIQGIWVEDAEQYIRNILRIEIMGDTEQKKYYIEEILSYIRDVSWDNQKIIKQSNNIIAFKDCLFDLETEEILDFSPEYFIINKIDSSIDVCHKECYAIDKFFDDVIEEKKELLYELIAYCLLRDYPYQKIFILYGRGSNGKTVFLNLLRKFLGNDNVSCETPQELAENRFSKGYLWNKLANISSDIPYVSIENTNTLKELTGGDYTNCERKFKEPFPFKNYAKLIFSSNELPSVNDKSYAFFRRIYIIKFENIFEKEEQDPFLLKKLITYEELSGLSWKCLDKLKELKRRNFVFSYNPSLEDMEKEYEDLSNPFNKFLREECIEDSEAFIPKYELSNRFMLWLRENGFRVWSDKEIRSKLKEKYVETRREVEVGEFPNKELKDYRCWKGIKLKDNSP